MRSFWSDRLAELTPYVPGEQPKDGVYIKLNTNENPYPPSPAVLRAIAAAANGGLRLYPDPECRAVRTAIAEYYGLNAEQVFVGNGSDEVLAMAYLAFFSPEDKIAFPAVSYSFYPVYADLFAIPYDAVALREDYTLDLSVFDGAYQGVVFANPNAPTGMALPLEQVEALLQKHPDRLVIVDEAYVDFGAESALKLVEKYENLLVVQTFSKSRSLAGMRIGFAIGNPVLIKYLNDVKYSFNSYTMDQTALSCGVAAVKDEAYFQETTDKIKKTRENAKVELAKLGFSFPDSKANFLFITHPEYQAKDLFKALREEGIYVRYFAQPRIDNYLRVSIGTDGQMEALYAFLRQYMGKA